MKKKLKRGLKRDSIMLKDASKMLKNNQKDKFKFKVSITKKKYIQMLKERYISCLIKLSKAEINKGIKEINETYPNKFFFDDVLICIKFKN